MVRVLYHWCFAFSKVFYQEMDGPERGGETTWMCNLKRSGKRVHRRNLSRPLLVLKVKSFENRLPPLNVWMKPLQYFIKIYAKVR